MLVHELRHHRPSGRFSKSGGLSASISFLSSPLPPPSFTCTIFHAVFDFHSSFFSPKPHGDTCYAGYATSSNHRLMSTLQCAFLAPDYLLCCQALFQSREPKIVDHEFFFNKVNIQGRVKCRLWSVLICMVKITAHSLHFKLTGKHSFRF